MPNAFVISKTELARRTRQVVDRARRGDTVIVSSYGEEQVVVMDAVDYRILRAVASYQTLLPHPAPVNDPTVEPLGLSEAEVERIVREAGGSPQARWDAVIVAYLDGHINLGRAATWICCAWRYPRRRQPHT
jgi:prevent-host-death family protein